jgi:methionyl-tRNA formyltransferase
MTRPTAVVFGYHDVGVRCLRALLGGGVAVPLVVTHEDDPAEAQWFGSVAGVARDYGLDCVTPAGPGDDGLRARLALLRPDFVFSFYYRHLLPDEVLAVARRGALNMHGSLLPRYRGRAPVNWAVLRGERETGATLHHMVARADSGDIVDQQAVPILPDDTSAEVMRKVTVAAEMVLVRTLPGLLDGSAPRRPQPILPGEYFGRRRPEDGWLDWTRPARALHDLVRAVAPPFPGAFTDLPGGRLWIHATRVLGTVDPGPPGLFVADGRCLARGGDGGLLEIRRAAGPSGPAEPVALLRALGGAA